VSVRVPWKAISTAIAFGLAAVLLYLSLRGIDWRSVWRLLQEAKPGGIAIACASMTVGLFLRAARWRILLRAQHPVSMADAFWATCAGYFGNSFLPARAGELIRTHKIHTSSGLSRSYVLTTALSERVADAIALVSIGAFSLLMLPERPGWLANTSIPFAILGVGGILGIALAPRFAFVGDWLIDRFFPHAMGQRLHSILDSVMLGVLAFHDRRRLAKFGAMTVLIWTNDAAGVVVAARALHLTIAVPVAYLLLAGLGLASALPATPGYVGIYQFVAVSVLVPFGMSHTNAIGYILLGQALQYLVVGLWGAGGFWKAGKKASGPQLDFATSPLGVG
jgi:glycosyltransferase 2 family protein